MAVLTIAFDLDSTLDKNPAMWRDVVAAMRTHGVRCILCTCRDGDRENKEAVTIFLRGYALDFTPGMVYYSSRRAKKDYLASLGVKVDVWVDDDPGCILQGK